jgi:protein-tyrosine phosphatase
MTYYKRLPLEGMSNCRDLGGYPTKYGKTTNFGVFVRSEAPINLSKSDLKLLKDYKITKSLDSRGDDDIKKFPSSLNHKGFEYMHLPMFGRADALGFDGDKGDPSLGFTGWGKNYITWIESYKGWVRDVFYQLATCENVCQYNCNAGKDRTGIISALVLSVAGVDNNDIAFDYCISRAMLKPRFPELAKQWANWEYLTDENGKLITNHPFLHTPKSAMEQMLQYLRSEYKSVENYLLSCGIEEKSITEIRHKMIG